MEESENWRGSAPLISISLVILLPRCWAGLAGLAGLAGPKGTRSRIFTAAATTAYKVECPVRHLALRRANTVSFST